MTSFVKELRLNTYALEIYAGPLHNKRPKSWTRNERRLVAQGIERRWLRKIHGRLD